MNNEYRIKSWNDLQEKLFENSWNPRIGRYRSKYAFRGLSDAEYKLETTLMRLGGDYTQLENHLLRKGISVNMLIRMLWKVIRCGIGSL